MLEYIENRIYPPSDEHNYYRGGSVHKGSKVINLFVILAGGYVCSLEATNALGVGLVKSIVFPFIAHSVWASLLVMLISGASTCAAYHLSAVYMTAAAERLWRTPEGRARTKIQPSKELSEELRREAIVWGNVNAFLVGILGSGLFVLHIRVIPWSTAVAWPVGAWRFYRDCAITFVWIDLSAYWVHRFLHSKRMYKYLHKWHHRYTVPTPHAAFASHPVDFLVFQAIGMLSLGLFEINVIAFLYVAVLIAYHNLVEHSGVRYTGELPWTPTPSFHDDHHSQFTANFGFDLVLWDYMFGTLRKKSKSYSEESFHDTW